MADQPFIIVEALYPGLTQLDFTGPHTVFSRIPNTKIIVASEPGGTIESDGGLLFAGTRRLAEIERCDLLFVPGGLATTEVINDPAFMAEFKRLAENARYLTSVCTGSLILGAAGLLKGRRAACHWAWRHMLPLFGAVPDEARVYAAMAISLPAAASSTAGIDFALVVAAELAGEAFAQAVQLSIEYAPAPPLPTPAGAGDWHRPRCWRWCKLGWRSCCPTSFGWRGGCRGANVAADTQAPVGIVIRIGAPRVDHCCIRSAPRPSPRPRMVGITVSLMAGRPAVTVRPLQPPAPRLIPGNARSILSMKLAYCTYFDHNYLPRGLLMLQSLRRVDPETPIFVLALSDLTATVLEQCAPPGVVIVTLARLEGGIPRNCCL